VFNIQTQLTLVICLCWKTGQIFVTTELLRLTETDGQLAVVLAHEISHALLSHGVGLSQHSSSYIHLFQILNKFYRELQFYVLLINVVKEKVVWSFQALCICDCY